MAHDTELMKAELGRVLASPHFTRSPVLSKLLTFLVEETAGGRGDTLKAYSVAVDGLGRNVDFDPQTDSYPRVQVGRLRKMLDLHYAGDQHSMHRLFIPLGAYAVELAEIDQPQNAAPGADDNGSTLAPDEQVDGDASGSDGKIPSAVLLGAFASVVLAIIAFVAIWVGSGSETTVPPSSGIDDFGALVFVEPAKDEQTAISVTRVGMFLEENLARFDGLTVFARKAPQDMSAHDRERAYALSLEAVPSSENGEVALVLRPLRDGATLWAGSVSTGQPQPAFESKMDMLTATLGNRYGLIANDQRTYRSASFEPGYPCLLQYDFNRRYQGQTTLPEVQKCMKTSIEQDPNNPVLLEAASLLEFYNADSTIQKTDPAKGRELARQALVHGRNRPSGNIAWARAAFFENNCEQGKLYANRAIDLNPLETENLAFTGAYLFACGYFDEAEANLVRAIELDPDGPPLQYAALIFLRIREGNTAEALALAKQLKLDPNRAQPLYHLALSVANAANGNVEIAREQWGQVAQSVGRDPRDPPRETLRSFIIWDTLIEGSIRRLTASGVIEPQSKPE